MKQLLIILCVMLLGGCMLPNSRFHNTLMQTNIIVYDKRWIPGFGMQTTYQFKVQSHREYIWVKTTKELYNYYHQGDTIHDILLYTPIVRQ